MSIIDEYEKRLELLQQERQTELNDIQAKADAAQTVLDGAETDATKAYESMDTNAYHAAKERMRAASDMVDLYQRRLKALGNTPLITQDEYAECVSAVASAQVEAEEAAQLKLVDLIDQAVTVKDDNLAVLNHGNSVLKALHKARTGSSNGAPEFDFQHGYFSGGAVSRMTGLRVYTEHKEAAR